MDLFLFLKHHSIEYSINESVSRMSFVGIGGKAAIVAKPKNRGELLCLLSYLSSNGFPYKVVGNMSNILPPDGFWGICLISTSKIRALYMEDGIALAECGLPLTLLCKGMLLSGICPPIELFCIPATVGGAVYQNAGAYGRSIADYFIYADVYDPTTDRVLRLDRADMNFSYRHSSLASRGILLSAAIGGNGAKPEEAEQMMRRLALRRKKSQPQEPSLGSVFLRVGETSAAYYIDRAGLKGYCIGDAEVSRKHAGFIINKGNATAKDYRALISIIQNAVRERFCLELKTEIEIIEEKEKNAWLHFA